jgi:hypothetical protein
MGRTKSYTVHSKEVLQMSEIPEGIKFLLFGFGSEMAARMALVANSIGLVTIMLGVIAGATGQKLGLGATNWFLLTIALLVWGLGQWMVAYFGAK